jgi:hypothetical protein
MADALRGFARFWIDFVLGDDWIIAATIGLAIAASWGLVVAGVPVWWLLPLVVVSVTLVSLRRAVMRAH